MHLQPARRESLAIAISLLIAAFAFPACAQSKAPESPLAVTTITVAASPMPMATESASVSVIPREAIESSFAVNASELLTSAPFLNIQQQGGGLAFTTVTVRGGKPNLLLVMIDGVPMNDLSNELGGSFDFSSLPLDNLERVEIVRGPLSSVYGSEAVSGVVNFITRGSAEPSRWKLDDTFGSFGSLQESAAGSGGLGRAAYTLGVSNSSIGTQIGDDEAFLRAGDTQLKLPIDANRIASLLSRYSVRHAEQYPSGSGGPKYALSKTAEVDRSGDLVVGSSWQQQVNARWLCRVEGDLFRRTAYDSTPAILDSMPPGRSSLPATEAHSRFARLHLREANTINLGAHWSVRAAGTWRYESGVSNGVLYHVLADRFHLVRNTGESTAELSFASRRIAATGAVGTSTTPGFGATAAPRIGANVLISEHTRIKSSFGKAFNLPSFYSYAEPLVGNPHLRPEHLKAWDLGLEQALSSRLTFRATWFQNWYDSLITFSSAAFRLVNLNSARTRGVEVGTEFHTRKLDMRGWASYLAWNVQGSKEPLRNLPHGQGGISLDWKPTARTRLGADLKAVGTRYDYEVPVPRLDRAADYTTSTLRAQWEANSHMALHARLDNAFGQRYQQYVGFPDPGIRVRGGITWTFGTGHHQS